MGVGQDLGLVISLLLFSDDTLLFCKLESTQLQYLRAAFLSFELVSSLKVNLMQTKLVLVGPVNHIHNLTRIIGYKLTSLPMKYHDMPLGALYKSRVVWKSALKNSIETWRVGNVPTYRKMAN